MDQVKKGANWTEEENLSLVVSVVERIDIIEGKFSPTLTSATKNSAWLEVQQSVNSCSKTYRSLGQVKKRWADAKSKAKRKAQRNRALAELTGGGPPPEPLKRWEEMIVQVIPESCLTGIPNGGIDTFLGAHNKEMFRNSTCPCPSDASTSSASGAPKEASKSAVDGSPKDGTKSAASGSPTEALKSAPREALKSTNSCATEASKSLPHVGKAKKRQNQSETCICNGTCDLLQISRKQLEVQQEILAIKKQKLEVSKRRNELLEEILQRRSTFYSADDELSVSPIIKF